MISPVIADAARLAKMTPAQLAAAADNAALTGRSVRIEMDAPFAMAVVARRSGDCIVGLVYTRELDFDARADSTIVTSNGSQAPETIMTRSTPWPIAAMHAHPLVRTDQMVKRAARHAETGPQVFQVSTPAEPIATE